MQGGGDQSGITTLGGQTLQIFPIPNSSAGDQFEIRKLAAESRKEIACHHSPLAANIRQIEHDKSAEPRRPRSPYNLEGRRRPHGIGMSQQVSRMEIETEDRMCRPQESD